MTNQERFDEWFKQYKYDQFITTRQECGLYAALHYVSNLKNCEPLLREAWTATQPQWVSVKDTLPAKEGRYLIQFIPKGKKTLKRTEVADWFIPTEDDGAFEEGNKFINLDIDYDYEFFGNKITHWMPLPNSQ